MYVRIAPVQNPSSNVKNIDRREAFAAPRDNFTNVIDGQKVDPLGMNLSAIPAAESRPPGIVSVLFV